MPVQSSFSRTIQTLQNALTIAQRRHSLITSNISNVDTPGYHTKDIDFQSALNRAMETTDSGRLTRTDPSHIDGAGGAGIDLGLDINEDTGQWNGVNWVDLDKEITKLTENNMIYRSAVEAMLRRIATLKEVIREGAK
jgi:flagellar basal-body rod protein FlgB